jgi:hypothetical protein
MAASGVLYLVVVGLLIMVSGAPDGSETAALSWRAGAFAMTFGLVTGAHWSFGLAQRWIRADRSTMLVVKALTVAMIALAIALVLTGGRWAMMFDIAYGPALVVLVVLWMAMTHVVAKIAEKGRPARRPVGA